MIAAKKSNAHRKATTAECHFCDYWDRKKCVGHKCNRYKRIAKRFKKTKKKYTEEQT